MSERLVSAVLKTRLAIFIPRTFGMFSRSFTLPSNAKDDDVKAAFSDGVLKVEIGKGDEPKAKAIQIR